MGQDIESVIPLVRFEVNFAWGISRRWALFGGPSLNNLSYRDKDLAESGFIPDIAPYTMYETTWNGWNRSVP